MFDSVLRFFFESGFLPLRSNESSGAIGGAVSGLAVWHRAPSFVAGLLQNGPKSNGMMNPTSSQKRATKSLNKHPLALNRRAKTRSFAGPRATLGQSIPNARCSVKAGSFANKQPAVECKTRMPVLTYLRRNLGTLSPIDMRIAGLILAAPEEILSLPIARFRTNAKVSLNAVMRFCRRLNFKGYADFKIGLAGELSRAPRQTLAKHH